MYLYSTAIQQAIIINLIIWS